jgi:signal transduction histidine kinase
MDTRYWLRAAGFVTWVASGVPAMLAISAGRLTGGPAIVWVIGFAAFGLAFGAVCFGRTVSVPRERTLVLVQSVAGALTVSVTRDGLAGAILVVAAAQMAELVPPRTATAWVIAHTAVIVSRYWWLDGWVTGLTVGGAYLGFQMFAMATASLAYRERLSREELARANAELQATQALLSENIRVAERLRISRDLHDTLGHHLTALSLQLEVASRLSSGAAADRINEAHAITKLLLSDVRDVVSRLRETSSFDLGAAIQTLARAAVQPQVHIAVPEGLAVDDPLQAHAILRCVQEVITNTMRHAQARNLWITVDQRPDGIALTARDDGRGVDAVTSGNGLRGMRERFEELSGRVDFSSRPGAGFEVQAFVPK